MRQCLACRKHIGIGDLIECSKCRGNFHYECVRVNKAQYESDMHELQPRWICPECIMITRRPKRDDTPLKAQHLTLDETIISVDEQVHEDQSILGDTLDSSPTQLNKIPTQGNCMTINSAPTLDQISKLLDEKLNSTMKYILSEITTLRSSVHKDIEISVNKMKSEILQQTNALEMQQNKQKNEIMILNDKINKLGMENAYLKEQLLDTKQKLPSGYSKPNYDTSKKIVLYGLEEYYHETQEELQYRIVNGFQEILNVNLVGYIEDLKRIGRQGTRRPIIIELISKSMTKYILQNVRVFKNSGLSISKLLDEESLQKRKRLQVICHEQRKSGKYAIMRDNRLFVDGKEYTETSPNQTGRKSYENIRMTEIQNQTTPDKNKLSTLTKIPTTQKYVNSSSSTYTAAETRADSSFRK